MTKFERRDMKKRAKGVLKQKYLALFLVCLIAFVLGSEFASGSSYLSASDSEPILPVAIQVARPLLKGDTDKAAQIVSDKLQQFQSEGRSKGVLAGIFNSLQSGELVLSIFAAVQLIDGSGTYFSIFVIVFSLLVHLTFWMFINNCYGVFMRGIFLELRTYDKLTMGRTASLMGGKSWLGIACGMVVQVLYQFFWSITIVGGLIKCYSYWATSYILAENPHLSPNQAITLSRKMMKGHKWECFKYEFSFFFWYLLDGLTMGFVGVFFSNLYTTAAYTEYYVRLREQAKEAGIEGIDALNDRYLFERPTEEALVAVYPDMPKLAVTPLPPMYDSKYFLTRWFGVTWKRHPVVGTPAMRRRKIQYAGHMLRREIYPEQLCPVHRHLKEDKRPLLVPTRTYSLTSMVALFFTAGIIGWLWEVSLHIIKFGEFHNRGSTHGPWLPIYAFGCILILMILYRLRSRPMVLFVSTLVLCGILEYATSWYMEMAHNGTKWWDYTGYFLNLNGRICAEGLLVFGLAGLLVVYLLGPILDNYFLRIKLRVLNTVCSILVVVFICDCIYSHFYPNTGKGITDYGKDKEAYHLVEPSHLIQAEPQVSAGTSKGL